MTRVGTLIPLALASLTVSAQTGTGLAKASAEKIKAAQSLSLTMQVTFPNGQPQTWHVKFLKPNLYVITAPDQEFHSDGKVESVYLPHSNQYQMTDRKAEQITDAPFAFGLNSFFPGNAPLPFAGGEASNLDKKPVFKVKVQEPGFEGETVLYLDKQTGLPAGYDEPIGKGKALVVRYSDLKLDEPLKPDIFAWAPPAASKPLVVDDLSSKLLAPDTLAPTPTLKEVTGTPLDLAAEFRTHKATLIYFWNGSPPVAEATSLKDLMAQLRDQRFQVVLVDFNATDAAKKDLLGANFPFPVVLDDKDSPLAKSFGVQSQVEFIIGSDGKVGPHFLGYDPDGIVRALRQRGFRI